MSNFSSETCAEINPNLIIFRIIIYIFVGTFVCIVGFIGNILSIIVLRRDRDKKNTTTWLLQALAVTDSLYLFGSILIQTLQTLKSDTNWWPAFRRMYPRARSSIWPIASMFQTTTVWIIVVITVDRYLAVTRPFTAYTKKRQHMKIYVALVFLVAALYNIPRFFEREVITVFNECTNTSEYQVVHTPFRLDRTYFMVYHVILHCIFRSVGPLAIVLILNIGLIKEFKRAQNARHHMTGKAVHQSSITLMVTVVVTVFIVCELPDALLRIVAVIQHDDPKDQKFDDNLLYLNVISNSLLTLNSAVNFLIYCCTGEQFRSDVKRLYYHCNWERQSEPSLRLSQLTRTISRETQVVRTISSGSPVERTMSHTNRQLQI